MDEQFDAGIKLDAEGMPGVLGNNDLAVGRGHNNVLVSGIAAGIDAHPEADRALGKHRIGHLAQRHEPSGKGRAHRGDRIGQHCRPGACWCRDHGSAHACRRTGDRLVSARRAGVRGVCSRPGLERCLGLLIGVILRPDPCRLGTLLGGAVVERHHKNHGCEEGHPHRNGIERNIAERRDGEQRREHECIGGDPAANTLHQTAQEAADKDARIHPLEAQMDAIEARLGNASQKSGNKSARGGLTHRHITIAQRQDEHTGSGAEAGEVPGAHRALDEVEAKILDVQQHYGVERPVQTQRHHERIEHGNENREDERREIVHSAQEIGHASACEHTDGADQEGSQRNHHEHG